MKKPTIAMKIEIVFLLLLIITKTLSFEGLLRTDELEAGVTTFKEIKSKGLKVELFIILYCCNVQCYNKQ